MTDTQNPLTAIRPENHAAARKWGCAGAAYDKISQQIADAIEHCVDRVDLEPGARVLDVATGTGWTARQLADRGYRVTAVDFGAEVLDAARYLSPDAGIDFQVADAEQLPFADGSFDAVVSTFGVMFCADPERAAGELARVCRPGGRIALATWATTGGIRDMFKDLIVPYLPGQQAPSPSPFEWGDRARLDSLFGANFDIGTEQAVSLFRARDGEDAYTQFAEGYGPIISLLDSLDDDATARFRAGFIAHHEEVRTELGIMKQRPYVIMAGTRR